MQLMYIWGNNLSTMEGDDKRTDVCATVSGCLLRRSECPTDGRRRRLWASSTIKALIEELVLNDLRSDAVLDLIRDLKAVMGQYRAQNL